MTPITGLSQVNGWAHVITHPSRLFTCVLSVSGKSANSVGKTLAEQVSHFRVTNSSELHNALLDLLQRARQEECRLQLACILFTEEKNILATHSGSVFLRRNHRIGEILSSEGELRIIEGSRVTDDVFVLATHQATAIFPELKNILHKQTEGLVTSLVAQLQDKENSSLSALAWVEDIVTEEAPLASQLDGQGGLQAPIRFNRALQRVQGLNLSRLKKNPLALVRRGVYRGIRVAAGLWRTSRAVFTNPARSSARNFLLIAGGLIILLIALVAGRRAQINREIQTLPPELGQLQQQLQAAQGLASAEPITARAETRAVLRGLEDLIAANQEKPQALKKLKEEYQLAQSFFESIAGTETQGTLEPFYDLRLAEADFVTKQVAVSPTHLVALDAAGQKIVSLELASKQADRLNLEDSGSARALAIEAHTLYVLADGLHAYDLTNDHAHAILKEQGDSDRDGGLLDTFATYLYVVNSNARNIYRYLENSGGLSDPIGWLVDKQGLEFGEIEDLAVDGDLWLTTKAGAVLKYTQGRPQAFVITELPTAFNSPLKIATHPDTEYVFILESARNRLVVLRKDGSFFKEIVSESFASANDLAVDRAENAAYVVSGSLVYKVSP